MEQNAAKIVSSAILGMDFKVVIVNGKSYIVTPPTIKKIAGAAYWLSDVKDGKNIKELLASINNVEPLAHALSWFIQGNDSLFEELSNGTLNEVIDGLESAYSLLSTKNFLRLSVLAKNVASLTAKQRQ
ncbi:hypothetical protein [Bacteroides sp. An322]|uniref:hypothetical protein n=1 Tax=Bacteroides sp. An322 TaxID=1965632 RepID=UPI000B3907F9|nr:hypothetical protein [Bacteroides sp. An322]OUO23708.1 hypothetical protein B5F91_02375 [Bacteroides sp. An322]